MSRRRDVAEFNKKMPGKPGIVKKVKNVSTCGNSFPFFSSSSYLLLLLLLLCLPFYFYDTFGESIENFFRSFRLSLTIAGLKCFFLRGRQRKCWIDNVCQCQNCSQWPPGEKTGKGSMLNRTSCPSDHLIDEGTEPN